ncbi:MAG TPA: endonuclease/exonuclease/phosphatase family protein [Vicinamibacteria bacterium]|nr:endonuclease/exonuclease/phosphatase family protein [Vicinamibacteria bacterium]
MEIAGRLALVLVSAWVVTGTALNLSRHPHWYVRGWDFPRPVIALLALACGLLYRALFYTGEWHEVVLLAALGLALAWQLVNIFPYLPIAPRPVKRARRHDPKHRFRLLISNVLIENRDFERWLAVVAAARPDVVIALEVDGEWDRFLSRMQETHPAALRHPLDNAYGMALYSRLPIREHRLEFLVQDDIPSLHVVLELPSGQPVWLHAVHPRPPEPLRNQDATPRDAELMKVARRIREAPPRPTVVAGDLNDVAWSFTTHLFLRESGLLDPRLGRGFYNTFNVKTPLFRFPLDHVFHSNQFRLVELRRLDDVGSDHFPVLIELSYEPEGAPAQPRPQPDAADEREVEERIQRAEPETQAGK